MEQTILEVIKYLLPALVVFAAAYMVLSSMIDKSLKLKALELKNGNRQQILPTRLQAYERLVLLLERIHPQSLITRLDKDEINALAFQYILVATVRTELQHNITQQLYVSNDAWTMVKVAIEEVISIINKSATSLPEEATAMDLSRTILEQIIRDNAANTVQKAINHLKAEASTLF